MAATFRSGCIIFLVLAAVLLPNQRSNGAEKVVLQLRWDHQFQFAGYYAAQWQGYYEDAGLQVAIRSAFEPNGKFHSVTREVAEGLAHFGTGAVDILKARDQGAPLVVLASIFQQSPVAFYALKGTNLESPADLAGLRVATLAPGSMARVELRAMLRAENIDPSTVHEQPIKEKLGLYDLAKGNVEVVSGFTISAGWVARELDLRLTSLRPASYGVNFYGSALFTHQRWIERNPDMVQLFISASLKGWEYALAHPEEIADRISSEFPRVIPIKDIKGFNRFQIEPVRKLTYHPIVQLGHINPSRWRLMHKALKDAGDVSGSLDLQTFIFDPNRIARAREEWIRNILFLIVAILITVAFLIITWIWFLRRTVVFRTRDLAEKELKYRNLIEGSIQGIAIIQDLKLMFANEALAVMYGYEDPEELIGQDTLELFIAPHERDRIKNMHLARMRGEEVPNRYEFQGLRKDGSLIWLEGLASIVDWNGQTATQVTYIDITERRQAEKDLRESEELFKAIFNNSPTLISLKDLEGRYLLVNQRFEEWSGMLPENVIGHKAHDIHPKEHADRMVAQDLEVLESGKVVVSEFSIGTGEHSHRINTKFPVRDGDGKIVGVGTIGMDITERKRVEEELRKRESLLRLLTDAVPLLIAYVDRDMRYQFVNAAFKEWFQRPFDEILGKKIIDVVGAEDIEQIQNYSSRAVAGERVEYERESPHMYGEPRIIHGIYIPDIDEHGEVRGFTLMAEDITGRKQAETELRESEEKFRNLAESSIVGLFIHRNFKPLFANKAFAEMFGFESPEEVVQMESGESLIHPEDFSALEDRIQKTREGKVVDPHLQYRGVRKDGEIIYLYSHTGEVMWEGQLARMVTIIDLTERKQVEDQLRQAQKMEAVGQLAGGVAHDFNNVLGIILMNAEILEMELGHQSQKIQNVIRATTRGAELTKRLLTFSRQQVLQTEVISINTQVEGLVDMLRRTLGENIAVESDLDEELWKAQIDPGQLENALLNLAINARDAMPRGGKLTIETTNIRIDDDEASAIGDLIPGRYIRLSVLDTGEGMTPEIKNRVFEPFFTTKETGKGTGLGLSMIFGFVKQSEGHITVDSEEGRGTTFNLYLPASEGEASKAEGPSDTEEFQSEGETILVVEDNEELRENVVHLLGTFGYKTYWAGNGEEALALLEDMPDIDLMLCDVVLPGGKNGPDIAVEARNHRTYLRVVFMSGYAPTGTPGIGQLPQGAMLLHKPFTKRELAQTLRAAFD